LTMSMMGPGLTTTRHNGKQKKSKSKRLEKARADHESWLKSMGVGKIKTPPIIKEVTVNKNPVCSTGSHATSDKVPGHGPAKDRKVYSGDRVLLGVATMHKSNMVPIFADRKEDAKDIAEMRRN
jgi:hypothetical protein